MRINAHNLVMPLSQTIFYGKTITYIEFCIQKISFLEWFIFGGGSLKILNFSKQDFHRL